MKTIKDLDLLNKKVIMRLDLNVPIKDGIIGDDNRIKESLATINYALSKGAKLIIMSHLGRVKTDEDLKTNSLKPVAIRLSELLNKEVLFVGETRGEKLETAISHLKSGDLLLMENTRFEDLNGSLESKNDYDLGKYWASLGDLFINDAFGTAHRAHASNVGIASHIPSAIGFLIEKELKYLQIEKQERPLTIIMGGAKISDKIPLLSNLVNVADYILIGGAMAYTFIKAMGSEIGSSLLDEESLIFCSQLLENYGDKIILPVDAVCAHSISEEAAVKVKAITELEATDIGLDIGPKTVMLFEKYINKSNTVIWNGPMGVFEMNNFASGTKALCKILAHSKCKSVVGGGDTAAAVIKFGYQDQMDHISTGGGASLELLEGKILPGIEIINS